MSAIQLNINEVKEILKFKFMQMVRNPGLKVRPLYIEGHAGIGKSQVVRQAAMELTEELRGLLDGEPVECRLINLQFTERPEFMGLGYNVQEGDDVTMKYSRPILLPKDGFGFYFMDEANRTDRDIRSGMLTLLEDREVNGHKIGQFWLPVLAGNPIGTDDYETNDMDIALRDRIAKVVMMGDSRLTINHLKKKYPGHILLDYIDQNPEFLSYTGQGCSPRSFEYSIIATLDHKTMSLDLLSRTLAAELGTEGASVIMAYLKDRQAPKYNQILSGEAVAFEWLKANTGRNDVVASISKGFIGDLKTRHADKVRFSESEVASMRAYIECISDEHKLALVTSASGENITMPFMEIFIQGTPLVDFFINVSAIYNNQQA